ncbi:MAG: site-specific integrase [Terracidiphilus sp.]
MARRQGQIIPRGDHRWLVRIYLGPDPETRQRRYFNRTVRGSFHSAQNALNTQLAAGANGSELVGAIMTLNQYLDRWFELAVRKKLRAKSFRDYQALLAGYIRPALGEHGLLTLAPLNLQPAYHQMQQRGLSPRTVHYVHAVLHAALEQAVRWRLIPSNPARGVALPKSTRHEMHVLKPDQARRFLDHALQTKCGVLFALALTTGMRPSEYLALRWSDVNWQDETVTVRRTLEKGSGWQFADTKRPCSRRQVKLERWVANLLRQMHSLDRSTPTKDPDATQQIFKTRAGRPINSDSLARRFKDLLRQAGLPQMSLYSLRHTSATLALAVGVPAKVVSEQLGHASSALTLDVYSHLLPHMQSEAALRVAALLGMDGDERAGMRAQERKPPHSVFPGQLESEAQPFFAQEVG